MPFATIVALAVAVPAAAQENYAIQAERIEITDRVGNYDGKWQGYWSDDNIWVGSWEGRYTSQDGIYPEARGVAKHASPGIRLGYSQREREGWLSDCRLLMADQGGYGQYDDSGDDSGGVVIGGLVGAGVGGFAGNRVAGGSRLAGTLIGAGVGAIAGAAIGSAIDETNSDRHYQRVLSADELRAARYCDAYLRRYEAGHEVGYGTDMRVGHPYPSGGHHGHYHSSTCQTTVREEWVEQAEPATIPRPARRTIPRRQTGGKSVPIQ
ncbi:MAG: hypothetical protein WA957_12170 [Alteraurantiacibacter sp.]